MSVDTMRFTDNDRKWCRLALSIQNASNPSGVAHTIADTTSEMIAAGLPTSEIQQHPALVLMAAKLADLCAISYEWPAHAADVAQEAAANLHSIDMEAA